MADKIRNQYNAALTRPTDASGYYQTSSSSSTNTNFASSTNSIGSATGTRNCNICAILSATSGKTQEELDIIARNMTLQILDEMRSGKLARNQINQPNWFENRVVQKLEELNKENTVQYQENLYTSSRGGTGIGYQPIYVGSRNTYEDLEDFKQNRDNFFNTGDLRQIQENLLNQKQGGFYQGQSQSQRQHSYQTTKPISR